MSEGPQVLRRTEWLHKHLQGRRVVRSHSTRSDIPDEELTGRTVLRAFCKGKHIFIEFDGGRFLHNHLLMKGIWRKLAGQQLFFPDTMWLALYVGPFTICNLKGQMLKFVNGDAVNRHCNSLGPDAMSLPFPRDEIYHSLGATELPICHHFSLCLSDNSFSRHRYICFFKISCRTSRLEIQLSVMRYSDFDSVTRSNCQQLFNFFLGWRQGGCRTFWQWDTKLKKHFLKSSRCH